MAGIFAIYKKKQISEKVLNNVRKGASKLKHRGKNHRFIHNTFPVEIIFYQQKKTLIFYQ